MVASNLPGLLNFSDFLSPAGEESLQQEEEPLEGILMGAQLSPGRIPQPSTYGATELYSGLFFF